MSYILHTERLSLREFTLNDAPFMIELLNSPGWLQYVGDRNIKTIEDAQQFLLNGPLKSYEVNGFGSCLVEMKDSMLPVGLCSIIKRDSLKHPDIGYAFLPQYTGKGLASEIANATLKYATNTLMISPVVAICVRSNTSSIRVLEKIGMKFSNVCKLPGNDKEFLMYTT